MSRLRIPTNYAFWKSGGIIIILIVVLVLGYRYGRPYIQHDWARDFDAAARIESGLKYTYPAPELTGITQWMNSVPLTIAGLKGKVVLVDFWTSSSMNCVRELPYLKAWDAAYRDDGLVVLGVHSPQFDFEKRIDNVRSAVDKYGIQYPVALDNGHATWTAFDNDVWPAQFLIDKDGNAVYRHSGEGDYAAIENNIRYLLGVKKAEIGPTEMAADSDKAQEIYLGYIHAPLPGSGGTKRDVTVRYANTAFMPEETWMLTGLWRLEAQKVISQESGASLRLHFKASKVYLVMGTSFDSSVKIKLVLNGSSPGDKAGKDIDKDGDGSIVTITGHGVYELIDQHADTNGTLEIIVQDPNVEIYAITFGN